MTILASGQLKVVPTTIFEVSGADVLDTEKASIEKVTFFNENAAEQTAILFVKERFGSSRKMRQFKLLQNEGGEYLEPGDNLPLEIGDSLEAETTTANAVNFVVFGSRS